MTSRTLAERLRRAYVSAVVLAYLAALEYRHGYKLTTLILATHQAADMDMDMDMPVQQQRHDDSHSYSLVVLGAGRNVAGDLPHVVRVLERLQQPHPTSPTQTSPRFQVQFWVMYENDSTDDTVAAFQALNHTHPLLHHKLRLISTTTTTLLRTDILAHARNQLWAYLDTHLLPLHHHQQQQQQQQQQQLDFVLMMDLDDVTTHMAHLHTCLDLPHKDWAVCCANSVGLYYDLYALRTHPLHQHVLNLSCNIKQQQQQQPHQDNHCPLAPHLRHVSAATPPIRVQSCFGGAALYRWSMLQSLNLTNLYRGSVPSNNYNNNNNEDKDNGGGKDDTRDGANNLKQPPQQHRQAICEHVPFHLGLLQQNPQLGIYIQPKFLVQGQTSRWRPAKQREWKSRMEASWNDSNLTMYYRDFLDTRIRV